MILLPQLLILSHAGVVLNAVLAVGCLYLALPPALIIGTRWLSPVIVAALLLPTVISHQAGRQRRNVVVGFAVAGQSPLLSVIEAQQKNNAVNIPLRLTTKYFNFKCKV